MGIDVERFVDKPPDSLTCPICYDVLHMPVVLECEHMYCRDCLGQCFARGLRTCAVCKRRVDVRTSKKPQLAVCQILAGLRLRCSFSGCQRVLELDLMEGHELSCRFRPVHCRTSRYVYTTNRNDSQRMPAHRDDSDVHGNQDQELLPNWAYYVGGAIAFLVSMLLSKRFGL